MNNDEGSHENILLRMKPSDDVDFDADECQYLLSDSETEFRTVKPKAQFCSCFSSLCSCLFSGLFGNMSCFRRKVLSARIIHFGAKPTENFPPNVIKNQKYSFLIFFPKVLYEQFQFFLNFFFLAMAMSQFIPELRIGYLYTYWGPLGFVITVTMIREAIDDLRRRKRDQVVNQQVYIKLTQFGGEKKIASSAIKVGDFICVEKDQRVPADLVFLRTSETSGASFIRTDQLDGETDWKLKVALPFTQKLERDEDLFTADVSLFSEKPQKDIYNFIGKVRKHDNGSEEPLSIENTLWTNTVLASGRIVGVVIYTGSETRAAMNNNAPRSKVGLLDYEVNNLTKVLFVAVICLSFVMICLKGFGGPWYRYFFRFLLLFSYIIPLSLRVNLDLGKSFYSWMIQRDKEIKGTVVRSSTIPEELGRISYLLTDKTGTLTQNEMVFKMLDLGSEAYGTETFDEVSTHLQTFFSAKATPKKGNIRRTIVSKIGEAAKALALCHNVTPVQEDGTDNVVYQAASPDEVALVKWTELVGLSLVERDLHSMKLKTPGGSNLSFSLLQVFPFKSETKRMGVIVKDNSTGEITLYVKGADTVMSSMVEYNDWLTEKSTNLAKKGLRTLVVAKKSLTQEQYDQFEHRLKAANLGLSLVDRTSRVSAVIESLECDLQLLCLTGVEDKLQNNVKQTLEILKNAGMKIWMLTGDKLETATCIAKSSRLVSPTQKLHVVGSVSERQDAHRELNLWQRKTDSAVIIKGDALDICLKYLECELMELAVQCPAVIVCRCSPTQKSLVVKLIQKHTGKKAAAIGDGGNDVAMIQAADVGIGIEGKEGRQASLAADFSITQFEFISRLFLVHGRYSYRRSAALSQFVIHRGLIISTIQAIFSAIFYFSSVALYQGFLMVGYATFYTNFPVFSLVLDRDVTPKTALDYPELYKDLTKGRSLSYKTFFLWVFISIYQGGILMYGAMLLFEDDLVHIVSISFTALIMTELLMVALTIRTWHPLMVVALAVSLGFYVLSLVFLQYFDWNFIKSEDFLWKVVVLTIVSCLPLYILKFLSRKFTPSIYAKLEELNTFGAAAASTRRYT